MKPPLAILGRHSTAVLFQEGGYSSFPVVGYSAAPVALKSLKDAEAYLSYWLPDGAAMSRLRQVLHELGHGRSISQSSDREVVAALAAWVVAGILILRERDSGGDFLNVRAAFAAAAAAAAAGAPAAGPVVRPAPPPPPEPPLLPLLEELHIEGAEVLPEILQTLDQVKAGLDTLDLASVSLEPAPSEVPGITEAMSQASGDVTSTLGDL